MKNEKEILINEKYSRLIFNKSYYQLNKDEIQQFKKLKADIKFDLGILATIREFIWYFRFRIFNKI